MYTIGQVAAMTGLPVSTLRYYDNEGLFPTMRRTSGIRQFSDRELQSLKIIECLKKSGLDIKAIKLFMHWCTQGSSTYPQRRQLFLQQKSNVEAELEKMQEVLNILKYKCWYYEQAQADGNEERLKKLTAEQVPAELRATYLNLHKK